MSKIYDTTFGPSSSLLAFFYGIFSFSYALYQENSALPTTGFIYLLLAVWSGAFAVLSGSLASFSYWKLTSDGRGVIRTSFLVLLLTATASPALIPLSFVIIG